MDCVGFGEETMSLVESGERIDGGRSPPRGMRVEKLNVGILIFDGVEVLDFAGPFEVFSRTRLLPGVESRRSEESAPFLVFTVARSSDPVAATGGLRVLPDYDFESAPPIDLLVVPGGFGTRPLLEDAGTLEWVARVAAAARLVTSVCTGALVLARANLLRNRRATTHWGSFEFLTRLDPTVSVQPGRRVVEDGVVTSAGVSAGIDMALTVVEGLFGQAVADETARYIEYPRHETGGLFEPTACTPVILLASATADDLGEILHLLRSAGLPVQGVEASLGDFLVAREDGSVVGVAGLEVHGRIGLLRSVAVLPTRRSRGLGRRLVEGVLERAVGLGLGDVYLLTTSAAEYFARFGFAAVSRPEVPAEIRGTAEFRELCPETAVVMRRALPVPGG